MNQSETLILRGALNALTKQVVENNEAHGWYKNPVGFLGAMALLHSEVSEAVDAWRVHGMADATAGNLPTDKPEGVGSEFADIFIRLLDNCYLYGVDLAAEVQRKMNYNATRPYRHGGKRA